MRKYVVPLVVAVAMTLVVAGTGTSASTDKGRRLSGPFCINLNTGVVRSVAVNQKCRAGEVRKVGVAIPCKTLTPVGSAVCVAQSGKPGAKGAPGPAGPAGPAGEKGAAGSSGAQGAQGAAGAAGPAGPAGKVSVEQLTGDQSNCVRISGSDGTSGVVCGTAGPAGPAGPTGPAGVCECKGECQLDKPKWGGK